MISDSHWITIGPWNIQKYPKIPWGVATVSYIGPSERRAAALGLEANYRSFPREEKPKCTSIVSCSRYVWFTIFWLIGELHEELSDDFRSAFWATWLWPLHLLLTFPLVAEIETSVFQSLLSIGSPLTLLITCTFSDLDSQCCLPCCFYPYDSLYLLIKSHLVSSHPHYFPAISTIFKHSITIFVG